MSAALHAALGELPFPANMAILGLAADSGAAATSTQAPPPLTLVPFVLLLLAVALLPLIPRTAHWWEHNLHKFWVSIACGGAALVLLLLTTGGHESAHALQHAAVDFIPFIVLLGALYVISGGVLITGSLTPTPAFNAVVLTIGAALANVLGTTGASMLLIRPMLRSNQRRKYRVHTVIFFIFMVSNMGGLLLPIGDPPLFLGYLRGVPFEWTLTLLPQWVFAIWAVVTIYVVLDTVLYRRERRAAVERAATLEATAAHAAPASDPANAAAASASGTPGTHHHAPLRMSGSINLLLLAGVVWATAALVPGTSLHGSGWIVPAGARELVTVVCALASLKLTPSGIRRENHFTFGPILEVAALFSGLFIAMQPALHLLGARGADLGLHAPAQFFWATGVLSGFLDNAPTYLVFANVGAVVSAADAAGAAAALQGGAPALVPYGDGGITPGILTAISCGAVFMGALTYIGNGPNLMVAAIARAGGVPMPSFFGYMLWSGAVLLPVFAIVTLIFFR